MEIKIKEEWLDNLSIGARAYLLGVSKVTVEPIVRKYKYELLENGWKICEINGIRFWRHEEDLS